MGKKKSAHTPIVIEHLKVESAASEGFCVAKHLDKVIFIKNAVPGDIVDVKIYAKKKGVSFAEIIEIHEASPNRIEPSCKHFGTCGGCKWQQMNYSEQLHWKEKQITDAFNRIGHIECQTYLPIKGNQDLFFYRNKMEYAFSNKRWLMQNEMNQDALNHNSLGFHVPGRFDKVVQIDKCWLQDDLSNQIRNFVYDYAIQHQLDFYDIKLNQGLLRNLMLRNSSEDEWMLVFIFGNDNMDLIKPFLNAIQIQFPTIVSLYFAINTKVNDSIYDIDLQLYHGTAYIETYLNELKFRIRPKSFFQTNTKQAITLYQLAKDMAELKPQDTVYDLYCGTGTISLFMAKSCKHVYGIESVPQAIEDAHENAMINGISNCSFYVGDMRYELNDVFVAKTGKPDVIITDPPRNGMHEDVLNQLIKIKAPKIVYISCNPATQARDLSLLQPYYTIVKTQGVDMFPQTHHVENVTLLYLK